MAKMASCLRVKPGTVNQMKHAMMLKKEKMRSKQRKYLLRPCDDMDYR
jgi:hypothetical protein